MIYTTGTVSTVSGSAIVSGTGTKWTVNNPAIRSGTIILIKNGNANFIYMVDRVNSDTELVISQPATFTVKNTSYSINLTEPNSYSDANNRMTAIASDTTYFLRAMDQWMMNNGVVTVELSNGQKVTLDSIKKMQGDISNKADLTKQSIQTFNGIIEAIPSIWAKKSQNNWVGLVADEGRRYIASKGEGDPYHFKIFIPEKKEGTMMLVGDYGLGAFNGYIKDSEIANPHVTKFFSISGGSETLGWGYGIHIADPQYGCGIFYNPTLKAIKTFRTQNGMAIRDIETVLSTSNTSTDPQGFIKKASPIVNINPDGTFTTNDESEGATVTRVAQGEYLIEGVLGFNSDAGWGGVDGGIEIPLDVNKQPLIWVDSEVMEDGSILVRTYHRTHPNAPKFARNDIDGYKDGDPIDIPDGRFISVRVQMPEQSIYNVRMREMEEAQKAEEE
ncbi:TPA: hypothetical protein OUB99_002923 [Proteus mirabilis]|nr:hypothetical protein [Proteus mirabilis]